MLCSASQSRLPFSIYCHYTYQVASDYVREPLDGLAWMRDEEPKIFFRLKLLMLSMKSDFENGKFPYQTCVMEHESILRALYGRGKFAVPNSISVPLPYV